MSDGGFWVKAEKYPGLRASGRTPEELCEALHDAILTYFDVPRGMANRLPNNLTLQMPDGTIVAPSPVESIFAVARV